MSWGFCFHVHCFSPPSFLRGCQRRCARLLGPSCQTLQPVCSSPSLCLSLALVHAFDCLSLSCPCYFRSTFSLFPLHPPRCSVFFCFGWFCICVFLLLAFTCLCNKPSINGSLISLMSVSKPTHWDRKQSTLKLMKKDEESTGQYASLFRKYEVIQNVEFTSKHFLFVYVSLYLYLSVGYSVWLNDWMNVWTGFQMKVHWYSLVNASEMTQY